MDKEICKTCCLMYFQGLPEDRISDVRIDSLWAQGITPCFYNPSTNRNEILPRKIDFPVKWTSNSKIPKECILSLEQFMKENSQAYTTQQ